MSGVLTGRTILVTRPADRAGKLVAPLEERGATTYVLPAIDVAPEANPEFDAAVGRLAEYDWAVVTSPYGVACLHRKMDQMGASWPEGLRLAVIGPETGRAAAAMLRTPDRMPAEYVSEAIADVLGDVSGRRILLARADRARRDLAVLLAERGAIVDEVASYAIVDPSPGAYDLPETPPDAIALTSAACVDGTLLNLQSRSKEAWMAESALACIGPITARRVEGLGYRPAAIAREYTIPGLVDALCGLLGSREVAA